MCEIEFSHKAHGRIDKHKQLNRVGATDEKIG